MIIFTLKYTIINTINYIYKTYLNTYKKLSLFNIEILNDYNYFQFL